MRKIIALVALVCFALLINQSVYAQKLASYGLLNSSLSTSSTGVVTGTAFALPSGYASIITWTVTADGSALSVNLEGSNDNISWFTMDSQTTATGGLKNFGFTAVKFTRCSQVSRTGGTATTCSFVVSRGYITSGSVGNLSRILVGNGTVTAPSFSFTAESTKGFYSQGANSIGVAFGGVEVFRMSTSGLNVASDVIGLRLGTSSDTILLRGGAAGKVTLTGTTPMFQLGGTSSSFVAIKQSGTTLLVRLADDSANAGIQVSDATIASRILMGANPLVSSTAPTISSGFGTSPSVANNNGTAAFTINVGTGGTATSGVVGLPAATTGWNCHVTDITATAAHTALETMQIASTTTTVTIESQNRSTGAASAWAASSILRVSCFAY